MSNAWYPKILSRAPLSDLLDSIAGTGDPIKVRLLDDTYTFSAAHDFLNDTTGAIGTDVTLTGSALVEGAWTADDVTWVALASGDTVNAAVLAPLAAKEMVDIQRRQGAWANVKTASGQTGWVRVLNLRTGSGQRGDAGVGALASVFKTGSSGNTVSTGVKGLSAEQLQNATPDPAEAERLNSFAVKTADARTFAKQGKLADKKVDYLPLAAQ